MNTEIPFILDALKASETIEVQVKNSSSLEHLQLHSFLDSAA